MLSYHRYTQSLTYSGLIYDSSACGLTALWGCERDVFSRNWTLCFELLSLPRPTGQGRIYCTDALPSGAPPVLPVLLLPCMLGCCFHHCLVKHLSPPHLSPCCWGNHPNALIPQEFLLFWLFCRRTGAVMQNWLVTSADLNQAQSDLSNGIGTTPMEPSLPVCTPHLALVLHGFNSWINFPFLQNIIIMKASY